MHEHWSELVLTVDFLDPLWDVRAAVSDDPEVGITVSLGFPNGPAGESYILGEQDALDILAAMNTVLRDRHATARRSVLLAAQPAAPEGTGA